MYVPPMGTDRDSGNLESTVIGRFGSLAAMAAGSRKGPLPSGYCCKSRKLQGSRFFRENIKQRVIADSYDLNRVTEDVCEFCVRP